MGRAGKHVTWRGGVSLWRRLRVRDPCWHRSARTREHGQCRKYDFWARAFPDERGREAAYGFCSWVVGWVIKTFPKEAELPMGVTVTRGLYRERFLTQPWGGEPNVYSVRFTQR